MPRALNQGSGFSFFHGFFVAFLRPSFEGSFTRARPLKVGHTPSTAGTFRRKFLKDPGNALRAFPGIPLESTAEISHPEHFQKSLPLSTAGDASIFRNGSREGLSELVMQFPAVLGAISDKSNSDLGAGFDLGTL